MNKSLRNIRRVTLEYLTYNKAEQRGIVVLSLIILGLIIANTVIPSGTFDKSPDYTILNREVMEFEAAWKKAADSDSLARVSRYAAGRYRFKTAGFDTGRRVAFPAKPVVMLELNSADTLDLQQLRGIGPGYARRIAIYRQKLRGYHDKQQLLEVFGMDSARYAMIKDNVTVNRDSVHPMDLNAITFKELLRHPYFPFPVTKNIMLYRQKNKRFKSVEELREVQGITDSLFRRMVIYLRIGP